MARPEHQELSQGCCWVAMKSENYINAYELEEIKIKWKEMKRKTVSLWNVFYHLLVIFNRIDVSVE